MVFISQPPSNDRGLSSSIHRRQSPSSTSTSSILTTPLTSDVEEDDKHVEAVYTGGGDVFGLIARHMLDRSSVDTIEQSLCALMRLMLVCRAAHDGAYPVFASVIAVRQASAQYTTDMAYLRHIHVCLDTAADVDLAAQMCAATPLLESLVIEPTVNAGRFTPVVDEAAKAFGFSTLDLRLPEPWSDVAALELVKLVKATPTLRRIALNGPPAREGSTSVRVLRALCARRGVELDVGAG